MPSLLEAIDTKYGTDLEVFFGLESQFEIFVPKKNPRHVIPTLLVLNDCNIDSAGDENELQTKCQGVMELDLAQNKLEAWEEVFKILKQVPTVTFVNLSFNRLDENLTIDNQNNFKHLKNLVLNATKIHWESIQTLLQLLPSLEELHLSRNDYENVNLECGRTEAEYNSNVNSESGKPETEADSNANGYKSVKILHFTGNPVTNWNEISKLGVAFPLLEALVLAECKLASLNVNSNESDALPNARESVSESDEKTDSPHNSFRQLKVLNLNHTLLTSWEDIERLAKFPSLRSVRLQGCPLFEVGQEYTAHERRQLVIARLPNVIKLNGGDTIDREEREDAERAFIRYYMDKPEEDRPERYWDLIGVHGQLNPLVQVDLSPEKRVKVTFKLGEKEEVRCISVYQTVQELKQKLESFTHLPATRVKLFYADQDLKGSFGPEEMKFPNKQLYSYNIASGDEIFVDEKC